MYHSHYNETAFPVTPSPTTNHRNGHQIPIVPSRIWCIYYNDLLLLDSAQCRNYNPATYIFRYVTINPIDLIFRVSFDNQEIRTQTPNLLLPTLTTPTTTPAQTASTMIQAQQRPRRLGLQNTHLRVIRTFRSMKRELARIWETMRR